MLCFAYCHETCFSINFLRALHTTVKKIPLCKESSAINESPSKTWSRSEHSFACFACCHQFCFSAVVLRALHTAMKKLRSPSQQNPELSTSLLLRPGVGQNITSRALHTAMNSAFSSPSPAFPVLFLLTPPPPHILYKHGVTCVRTVTQTPTWEMINCTSTFDWALNIQYLTHPAVCSVLRRQSKTRQYRKVQEPSSPVLNFKILISLFSCNYRWISAILH